MKEIPLTQGKVTLVDDDVFEWASNFRWYAVKDGRTFYAARMSPSVRGKRRAIFLHRAILQAPAGIDVDHIDHNGLNNLRENLRLCSNQQNHGNQQLSRDNTTGYKGVSRSGRRYRAFIKVNSKALCLGTFDTPEEAAQARDAAAIQHFGEFACLNFPGGKQKNLRSIESCVTVSEQQ